MKYTIEQTKERALRREHKKKMRTTFHHFALLSSTCCKCNREFQMEWGYRTYLNYGIAVLISDICNECAKSRAEACKLVYANVYGNEE